MLPKLRMLNEDAVKELDRDIAVRFFEEEGMPVPSPDAQKPKVPAATLAAEHDRVQAEISKETVVINQAFKPLNPQPIIGKTVQEPVAGQPPALRMAAKKKVNFAPADPLKGTEWQAEEIKKLNDKIKTLTD